MTRGRGRGRSAVLTVAGADPSGASGVYRDVATFEALGHAGVAAVTAVTAQNTSRFSSAEPVSARMISAQIRAVFEDFDVGAVKIGMVRGREAVAAVRAALLRGIGQGGWRGAKGRRRGGAGPVPVVVDPVVWSTTGGRLLDRGSLGLYKKAIVPPKCFKWNIRCYSHFPRTDCYTICHLWYVYCIVGHSSIETEQIHILKLVLYKTRT